MTKPKRFLDSLRQMVAPSMEKTCAICHITYAEELCPSCGNASGSTFSASPEDKTVLKSAYLVDLVSNHKILIPVPTCKVGRDESNDVVISGDQAISRQHLLILKEGEQFFVEDIKSRHGTFINGNQLTAKALIKDGDVIKIGVSLFWFIAEINGSGVEDASSLDSAAGALSKAGGSSVAAEPQHVSVNSEFSSGASDPSTSTATDIPIMTNEEVLLDRLRLKARSFENTDLFVQSQLQPGILKAPSSVQTVTPAASTQQQIPALDGILSSISSVKIPAANTPLSSASNPAVLASAVATQLPEVKENPVSPPVTPISPITPVVTTNRQSLAEYISKLAKAQSQLQIQIEQATKRRQEITDEIALTHELIKGLIGGSGNTLVESCQKMLSQLGWQSEITGEDRQDLQLTADNQTLIAHITWTGAKPDRSQLGKLFIAQTRLWCEQGLEPKGIFIISRLTGENEDKKNILDLDLEAKAELADFVKTKNVCLLTAANLLAIYHDITQNNADTSVIRQVIINTNGWLEGYDLVPLDLEI